MTGSKIIRGITWDHSRAFPPLVAAAQCYLEMYRNVDVRWQKRSLHEFGHADITALAQNFDLLIIDHPWAGEALAKGDLLTLEGRVDKSFLAELASSTMGPSFDSYVYDGKLIALPIDVATQVASYRSDLLERAGTAVPSAWEDVLVLARQGRVLIPGFHVDVLLTFLGMCVSVGGEMFADSEIAVSGDAGRECLQRFRELASHLPEETWQYNPIAVYEQMCSRDDIAYCPFAYGYQNYARDGFAAKRLRFANLAMLSEGQPLRGVLGGTGIAISAKCDDPEAAVAFSSYVASEVCQRHIYLLSGGQPSHRAAWDDAQANGICGNFYLDTYRSTEEAWVRPRYAGYVSFQESAGIPIVEYLQNGGSENQVLDTVNAKYRESLKSVQTDRGVNEDV